MTKSFADRMATSHPTFPRGGQQAHHTITWNQIEALFELISLSVENRLPLYDVWMQDWDDLVTQLNPYLEDQRTFTAEQEDLLDERNQLVGALFSSAKEFSYEEPPTLDELRETLGGGGSPSSLSPSPSPSPPPPSPQTSIASGIVKFFTPKKQGETSEKGQGGGGGGATAAATKGKQRKGPVPEEVAASIIGCDRPKKFIKALLGEDRKGLLAKYPHLQGAMSVLLYGPSGTGKGRLSDYAEALVGTPCFRRFKPGDVKSLVGETEAYLQAFFQEALRSARKENKPFVLWFDEMDFMSRSQTGSGEGSSGSGPKIFETWQLGWNDMDTETDCQVVVLGATNYPQRLPEAVLDRFKLQFYVPLPTDEEMQQAIEKQILPNQDMFAITAEEIPRLVEAFSGRSYRNLKGAIGKYQWESAIDDRRITVDDLIKDLPPRTTQVVEEIEEWRRGRA